MVFVYDIIALSEMYLNESIKDEDIQIEGLVERSFAATILMVKTRVGFAYTLKRTFLLNEGKTWKSLKKL